MERDDNIVTDVSLEATPFASNIRGWIAGGAWGFSVATEDTEFIEGAEESSL